MLHVLVQFACTEYEYKPRKAKPSPTPNWTNRGAISSTQATPTTLGLNIHVRKSSEKKLFCFSFYWNPFNSSAVL